MWDRGYARPPRVAADAESVGDRSGVSRLERGRGSRQQERPRPRSLIDGIADPVPGSRQPLELIDEGGDLPLQNPPRVTFGDRSLVRIGELMDGSRPTGRTRAFS